MLIICPGDPHFYSDHLTKKQGYIFQKGHLYHDNCLRGKDFPNTSLGQEVKVCQEDKKKLMEFLPFFTLFKTKKGLAMHIFIYSRSDLAA